MSESKNDLSQKTVEANPRMPDNMHYFIHDMLHKWDQTDVISAIPEIEYMNNNRIRYRYFLLSSDRVNLQLFIRKLNNKWGEIWAKCQDIFGDKWNTSFDQLFTKGWEKDMVHSKNPKTILWVTSYYVSDPIPCGLFPRITCVKPTG